MDIHRDGNFIEAGVWFVIVALVFLKRRRSSAIVRSVLLLLAVTLAVFGGSDIVEAHTGAWWKPWWLFVWKAICVAVLLFGFMKYFRLSKAERGKKQEGINVAAK